MTKAVMYWNLMRLEVNGHAGGGEKGSDLICAAVSMLTAALGGALEEAEKRGRADSYSEEKDGQLIIWADPHMGSISEVKAYFRMCCKGFRMLQEQYPENVKIEEVN